MNNLRFTPAIQFVLHSLLSLFIGALVAGLVALGQALFSSSDPKVILGAGLAAFSAWWIHGFVALKNSPQLGQAEADALAELKDTVAQLLVSHQQTTAVVNSLVQQQAQAPVVTFQAPAVTTAVQPQFVPLNRNFTGLEIPAVQQP